jgi:hypothetical protein
MTIQETRYSELLTRCSDSAESHLGSLRTHPLLPEIADILEATTGPIRAEDIEDAFADIMKRHATLNDKAF